MASSVADFIGLLRESRILEPDKLDEISKTPEAGEVDSKTLADCLIQLGWLTPYQVDQVLSGRGQDLLVGPYRILERLGENGSGTAFKARHPEKHGIFALKLFPKTGPGAPALLPRFFQEALATAQLAHPNIALGGEVIPHGDRFVFAREFVEGVDISRLTQEKGPLSVAQACDYVHQAAQGMDHAHRRGLTHRHLQASNLIVAQTAGLVGSVGPNATNNEMPSAGAVIKIVDLGLGQLYARLGEPGQEPVALGPGGVAPPLVARPERIQSDIHDLGKTFENLLGGVNSMAAVPAPIRDILRKMTSNDADGFRSFAEVEQALAPFAGSDASLATATETEHTPPMGLPTPKTEEISLPAPAVGLQDLPKAEVANLTIEQEVTAEPVAVGGGTPMPTAPTVPALHTTLPGDLPAAPPPLSQPVTPDSPVMAAPVAGEAPVATAPLAGAITAEPPTEEVGAYPMYGGTAAPPRVKPKKKYSKSFIMWAIFGLLLHVVALGIFITAIIIWSSDEKPTQRPTRPMRTAPKAQSQLIDPAGFQLTRREA